MDTTFDVRVWQIERGSGKLRESYGVRWSVGGKRHRKTFQTFALADGFRAELVTATHAGEPFSVLAGSVYRRMWDHPRRATLPPTYTRHRQGDAYTIFGTPG